MYNCHDIVIRSMFKRKTKKIKITIFIKRNKVVSGVSMYKLLILLTYLYRNK